MNDKERASKGGKARAAKMTPEQRSASARKAVNARWAKVRAAQVPTVTADTFTTKFTFVTQ